ncbi:zinc dependent protease family protein [Candidatus Nitrosoglobus terrae]|uniref:Zinc dependent protease family protein n=1 Tax=Candidatus Nitrosoglobus terrae TaxID=1630141 RepID=A0A1Q2SKJ1_9GAMM|nr:ATP-dependent zinc protease [Candidatus Nitrosoglobus terrae]BAW79656.1 zinc dependent protease family protein [Candidatus Nitrosoglobus terrae]
MNFRQLIWTVFALSLTLFSINGLAQEKNKTILGWIELAQIVDWDAVIKAKMDTGALTSSLHATDIKYFQRKGTQWVRFKVEIQDQNNKKEEAGKIFKLPVYRFEEVRSSNGISRRRPIVLIKLCLGGETYEEQFSLNDRSKLLYPMLLGRRTIKHLGLIDVTSTYTLPPPRCNADTSIPDTEQVEEEKS